MELEESENGPLALKKGINSFRYKGCFREETKYRKLSIKLFAFHRSLTERSINTAQWIA